MLLSGSHHSALMDALFPKQITYQGWLQGPSVKTQKLLAMVNGTQISLKVQKRDHEAHQA